MSRIRTIKPEFWTSEQIMECSPLARLLFIGIWNFCDDRGVHPSSAKTLKAEIFPSDDITVSSITELVQELINQKLIIEFTHDGKSFWYVTGWHHQMIKNPSAPKYPAPPVTSDSDQTQQHYPSPTQFLPQSYPSPTPSLPQSYPSPTPSLPQSYPSPTPDLVEEFPPEGKGREGKGEEGKINKPPQEESAVETLAGARAREGGVVKVRKTNAPMPADWFPGEAAYDVLVGLGIPRQFAECCIPEFRLYWIERGDARPGWEASFVNSVKRSWDKRPRDTKVLGQRRPGQTIAERITEEHALIFGQDEPDPFSFLPKQKPQPEPRLIEGEVLHGRH